MAITKIYAIRNQLDQSITYAANEQKTTLDGAIEYAVNPDKTEKRLFESCLNCGGVESAFADMQATKEKYCKTGGVLGYHFIQSFLPGEVTPEQVHLIGVEFARQLFGDRFEVVIGTHLNKQHLHNHIVVNSVSFKDGKKYRSNMQSYYKEVRAVSDKLCEEHGLSVIVPKEHGKHYTEWKAEKDGKPTVRGQLRQDIDGLIAQSLNFTTFLELLEKSGYIVKYGNVKHTAVKPPYSQRFIRLDSLGESYTDAAIETRILTQKCWRCKSLPEKKTHYRCKGSLYNAPKIKGFTALYFHYVYLLQGAVHGTGHRKVSRYLMEDTVKFERYLAQHRFLMQNNIETMSDLQAVKATLQEKIENAIYLRKPLYEERRLSTEEQKTEALSHQITAQTAQLKTLRHDHRLCVQIECDAERIQKRTQEAQAMSTQDQRKVAVRDQVRRSK